MLTYVNTMIWSFVPVSWSGTSDPPAKELCRSALSSSLDVAWMQGSIQGHASSVAVVIGEEILGASAFLCSSTMHSQWQEIKSCTVTFDQVLCFHD